MANEVSRNDHHECTFYNFMDICWSETGAIFKHVLTSTNDMDLQHENKWRMDITLRQKLKQLHHNLLKACKQKFNDQALAMVAKVVENEFIMVKNIQQPNVLLEKFDIQMDCLINEL
jgi:hypothetical protein